MLRQTSDHALILLDSNPGMVKTKGQFIWEVKRGQEHEYEELVEVWGRSVGGSKMFRVKQKLKLFMQECISRRKERGGNARKEIDLI